MPAGYGAGSNIPGIMLSLREQPEGGNLRSAVLQKPLPDLYTRIEAVVLVHGFNNHEGEAAEAYLGFRSRQYPLAARVSPPSLENMLTDVFWPGDAAGWGGFDLADALVYPAAVGTAQNAAPRLARHLQSMPNLRIVHFVGHSLGCRVILETIKHLQGRGPIVGKVCLMAAAVPVFKVQSGGDLAGAMAYAKEVKILYSRDDRVLQLTFPEGQTVASGNEGFFPTALGREPPDGIPGRIDRVRVNQAGHSDYWGYTDNSAASEAAGKIASFFQFGTVPRAFTARPPNTAPRPSTAEPREVSRVRTVG